MEGEIWILGAFKIQPGLPIIFVTLLRSVHPHRAVAPKGALLLFIRHNYLFRTDNFSISLQSDCP